MEFTNDMIEKMKDKKRKYNMRYTFYYEHMAKKYDFNQIQKKHTVDTETGEVKYTDEVVIINKDTGELMGRKKITKTNQGKGFTKKSIAINKCLSQWDWDQYEKNKVLDLKTVVRCKDKFCPNCRKVTVAYRLLKYKKIEPMLGDYDKYLLTLTQPNCKFEDLQHELKKMQKAFRKFWAWIYKDYDDKRSFKGRLLQVKGAIKSLEVTYNSKSNTYHPHYHIMLFILKSKNKESYHKKHIQGPYRKKSDDYVMFSDLDVMMCKLWYMAYNNVSLKKYNNMTDIPYEPKTKKLNYYMCMTNELDKYGVYEIFKYTFKDADIINFDVFESMYWALQNKRLIQSLGILFNIDFEEEEENKITESLEDYIKKEESPKHIKTCLKELNTKYKTYKKISRFEVSSQINEISDN